MITFFTPKHLLHAPEYEFFRGERVACFESPSRADFVRAELLSRGHEVREPDVDSTAVLRQVFTEAGATPTSGTRFRVAALRDSDANRFYIRHGFVLRSQGEWDIEYQRKYKRGCERAPLALPSTDEPEGLPPR